MRDYTFPTTPGTAASVSVKIDTDLTGAPLTFEFSDRSDFATVGLTKTATGAGRNVTVSLTAAEVDSLKDAAYRVKAVIGGKTVVVLAGRVDYQPVKAGPAIDYNTLSNKPTIPTPATLAADATLRAAFAPLNDPRLSKTVNLGNVSGNVALDVSSGSVFLATITGNTTFSFVNWPAGQVASEPTVIATQDGVGHSMSFAGVAWLPLGASPVFQTGAGQVNVTAFFSVDGGVTVYGQAGSMSGGGFGVYGDGSDGAVVLDGTTTPSGFGRAGSTYWITRDVFLTSLTVATGYTLQLAGGGTPSFRLTCSGTVNIATGAFLTTFVNTASAGATGGSNIGTGTLKPGANAPSGTTGVGAAGTNVNGQSGGFAGRGGANGAGQTAGANGVSTLPAGYSLPRALPAASMFAALGPNITNGIDYFPGGASGSAGSGDGTSAGGAGGPGGNPLYVAAQNLVNNGTIQAVGGSGGNAAGGNAGGGGGGQGGPIVLIYGTYSGSGTILSRGGNGGLGAGTGSNGATGGAGFLVRLVN